ncbi:MAG: 30S ribosomal protein S6e [Candidatus Diapherotrites archaeon]|uniref:Small ribosomal subunit protein eS6 n=1 Tax=Candidatus Iainarchaeum sp. TaxID=3101447 RepID=A0A939C6P4_9ARCH|nr:30S ribosomal protein S6e [Candidatus Diapherotrites archaeon]
MNLVISDPKTGKAFNKKTESVVFANRKIGETVDLNTIGLAGYKAKIMGGSDKQGFPMKPSLQIPGRKKVLLKEGIGFNSKRKGMVKRKSVRGNTVGTETAQLNLAVTEYGQKSLSELLTGKVEKEEEEKETAKERMIRQSLENVGNVELAEEAKKIKGKVKR